MRALGDAIRWHDLWNRLAKRLRAQAEQAAMARDEERATQLATLWAKAMCRRVEAFARGMTAGAEDPKAREQQETGP